MNKGKKIDIENISFFRENLEEALDFYANIESTFTPMSPARKVVYDNIQEAFRGVTCKGEKAVLVGCAAKDDYLTDAEIESLSIPEERDCWQNISPQWLYACCESLCYAGPEAFRFLIPVYMCASLQYNARDGRMFEVHIGVAKSKTKRILGYSREQMILLDKRQKNAISMYLRQMWCEDHEVDFESGDSLPSFEYDERNDSVGITPWELDDYSAVQRDMSYREYVSTLIADYIRWMHEKIGQLSPS